MPTPDRPPAGGAVAGMTILTAMLLGLAVFGALGALSRCQAGLGPGAQQQTGQGGHVDARRPGVRVGRGTGGGRSGAGSRKGLGQGAGSGCPLPAAA